MTNPIPDDPQERLVEDLRGDFPEMSEKQLAEAAELLSAYARVVVEIVMRLEKDPEGRRTLDFAILEARVKTWSTCDGQLEIMMMKRGHRRPFSENLEP